MVNINLKTTTLHEEVELSNNFGESNFRENQIVQKKAIFLN